MTYDDFMAAPTGATALICVDDRYTHEGNAFRTVDEFRAMCAECHGQAPGDDAELHSVTRGADGVWRGFHIVRLSGARIPVAYRILDSEGVHVRCVNEA